MRASTSLRQFWLTHADTLHFQIVFAMIWLHVSKCLFHRCRVTGKVYKAPRQDGPTNLQLAHSSVPSRTLVSRLISNHGVDDLIKQSSLLITFFWSKKSIPTKLTRSNLLQYICFHLSKVTQSSNFDLEEAVVEIVVSVTPLSICGTPKRRMWLPHTDIPSWEAKAFNALIPSLRSWRKIMQFYQKLAAKHRMTATHWHPQLRS